LYFYFFETHILGSNRFLFLSKQKARDNRAALRINKVQMSNDSMKRQQQQDSIDPSSRIDSDLFKDPLKQRESEHEQEWKFRQV
jgi:histone-lysine N-methyltransferase MLL3